jgi:hypothetical protein
VQCPSVNPRFGLLEQDQKVALLGRGRALERDYLDCDVLYVATALDSKAIFLGDGVRLSGSSDRLSQTRNQAFAHQFRKLMSRLARRELEVRRRVTPHLNDIQLVVNDDAWRSMFGQDQPVRFFLHLQPGSALHNLLRKIHPAFSAVALAQRRHRRTRGQPHAIDSVSLLHLIK